MLIPIAAADDWWAPYVPILVGALALPLLVGAGAMVMMLRDLRTYVLPWFRPAGPGQEDVSLPAQVSRIKADIAPTNDDRSTISDRVDKAKHMAEDVAEQLADHRSDEDALRAKADEQQNEWKTEIRGQLITIKGGQSTLHRRIDTFVDGNPEVRPRQRVVIPTPPEFDASAVKAWLNAAHGHDLSSVVVLDMARTTICDSTGLGAMTTIADAVMAAGGALHTINVQPAPARSIAITNLGELLGVEP